MTHASQAFNPESLIEHEIFVRNVVRGLLPDEASVQDVVQDTWVQALQKPPTSVECIGSFRAWLARVGRNLATSSLRSNARRRQRETGVAHPEGDDSWERSVQRLETRQRVAQAVLALAEPYRTVVLLRYEHGMSPLEIGNRLGRSSATVRSQLSRAHELLRERLDAEFGGRKGWAILVMPSIPLGSVATSVSFASPIAVVALTALVAAASVWSVWFLVRQNRGTHLPVAVGTQAALQQAFPLIGVARQAEKRQEVALAGVSEEVRNVSESTPVRSTGIELPRAKLFDRSTYDDYERATFSFEYGLRDDPLNVTYNDWDLHFSRAVFSVNTVVDDQSIIVDLGEVALANVNPSLLDRHDPSETAVARQGHSYLVRTRDSGTDLVSAFELLELVEGEHCVLEWFTVNALGQSSGSLPGLDRHAQLAETLLELPRRLAAARALTSARVILQLRGGSVGGNPCRINIAGETMAYIDRTSNAPLDLHTPVGSDEATLAYFEGGFIPADKHFVVRRVSYSGLIAKDSNGRGTFELSLGGKLLIDSDQKGKDLSGIWTGEVILHPGDESSTYLQTSDSTVGEAVFEGELVQAGPAKTEHRLLANGMALFPRAEIPDQGAFSFDSGGLLEGHRRSQVNAGIGFMDSRIWTQQKPWFDLGNQELRNLDLKSLPKEISEPTTKPTVGSTYLICDPSGRLSVIHIEELVPDVKCVFDWYSLDRIGQASGSLVDTEGHLTASFADFRRAQRELGEMKEPSARLQLRVGSVGGNPCKIDLPGNAVRLELSTVPLELEPTPTLRNGDNQAYCEGGLIPDGQVFVVTRVSYRVSVGYADNRDNAFQIRVGRELIVDEKSLQENLNSVWHGRVELRPDEESWIFVLATFETAADVQIEGEFVPAH